MTDDMNGIWDGAPRICPDCGAGVQVCGISKNDEMESRSVFCGRCGWELPESDDSAKKESIFSRIL